MVTGILLASQVLLFLVGWQLALKGESYSHSNARLPLWCRMLLSISLIFSAFWVWQTTAQEYSIYGLWVFLGMIMSFAGDLAMAGIMPINNRMIGGILFFSIAHGLYITAYMKTIISKIPTAANINFYIIIIITLILTYLGWRFFINNHQKKKLINIAALFYALWISTMAASALYLALLLGKQWWITVFGALSFVLSDFIIGSTRIGKFSLRNPEIFIWLTYIAGQIGIIYAPWIGSML